MSFVALFVGNPKEFAEFYKTEKFVQFCKEFGVSSPIHSEEIPSGVYYPRQIYSFINKLEEEADKNDKVSFIVSVDLFVLSTWRAQPEGDWEQPLFIQTREGVKTIREILPDHWGLYGLDDVYYANMHKGV